MDLTRPKRHLLQLACQYFDIAKRLENGLNGVQQVGSCYVPV